MTDGESKEKTAQETESDLAKDVANLYSWANVEDAPVYRDFSGQRKVRHIHHTADVDIRKSEAAHVPEVTIESRAQEFESSAELSPTLPAESSTIVAEPSTIIAAEPPTILAEPSSPPVIEESAESAPTAFASVEEVPVETEPQDEALPEAVIPTSFFEPGLQPLVESIPASLAIYSLAGGVGKTTFSANLGRIFSAMKEKVLLVDASGSGLLPFYFGATDLRSGLRTFVAPDANYPPLQVIGTHEITKHWLEGEVKTAMRKAQRTIFDLGPAAMSLLPEIVRECGTVLVPLLPDLNSILTVSRLEASFHAMRSSGTAVPEVFYIFNRFDKEDSIDQRARSLVERQCGDRLLSLTIRDAAEIAKAIASRMTVADHSPGSSVTHDFLALASWVRKRSPIQTTARTQVRWSER